MKTFLTSLLLLIFYFNCTAQWVELNVGNTNATYFTDVYAITPDIVVVVGDNGTILKTTDGGTTWQQKVSGTTLNLGEVQFPTSNIGYVTAADGKLLKTNDSGETWTVIDFGINTTLLSLSCVNENLIFLSGINGDSNSIIIKSEDGGSYWETIIGNLPQARLYNIQFFNDEMGYAASSNYPTYEYKILKTNDGGTNWTQIENSSIPSCFLDENLGFFYSGGLYKTTDAGNTFSELTQSSWTFDDIYAVDENNIWGILEARLDGDGSTRGIKKIYSNDSVFYSETTFFENNSQIDMLSIHFVNENTGYVVGVKNLKGAIWKNTTGINTMGTLNQTLKSFQVYPNPASDKINISFNNNVLGIVTLTDMTGKQVYNQNINNQKEVSINVQSFAKGTYILTIENQKQTYSQKLIIQ